ncbi:MAG: hypothetical protein ACREDL_01035, partial [Bradyrhizobium sp.]
RPSTSRGEMRKDVDGRDKHGHDGLGAVRNHLSLAEHQRGASIDLLGRRSYNSPQASQETTDA